MFRNPTTEFLLSSSGRDQSVTGPLDIMLNWSDVNLT